VRLIFTAKADYLANTAPLSSQIKVLDTYSISSFFTATFMYSYHLNNLLPSSCRILFLSSNRVYHYETRLASQYRPHFCRTNIKQHPLSRTNNLEFFTNHTNHPSFHIFFKKQSEKIISLIVVQSLKFMFSAHSAIK